MTWDCSKQTGTVTALPHIRRMVTRFLSRLCFGSSFDDDTFAEKMVTMVEEYIPKTHHGSISDIFPFLRHFKLLDRTYRDTQRIMRRVVEFFTPILSSETLPPGCYAHFLLSQDVPLDATAYLVFEIFLLGMDSTVNTTAWALRFLILNPGIQEKLHEEVRDWCNSNGCKTVRAEDVGKLQYLQAVVKETLRMKPIAPLVPRKAVVDTTLAGKKVPMDAEIFVNVYAVHYDPELWPKPDRFVPERFLPSASSKARKSGGGVVLPEGDNDAGDGVAMAMEKTHLPFGGGMRACAGVDVGKLQVAFAVANLVKAFQWSPVEGKGGAHDLDEELFFVLMMKNPLVARITPRSHI